MNDLPQGLVTGGPITDFVKDVAQALHTGNRVTAAQLVHTFLQLPGVLKTEGQADVTLSTFLQFLLDKNRYVDAATLLWPTNLFSGKPRAVKMLWDAVFLNSAIMVPGAASMGKSYNLGVFLYLDWRRDPRFTNIKIVGPSEDHLEQNLFSHLVKLHNQAAIKGPGEPIQLGIVLDPVQRDSGIFGVVVPTGKKSAGRLQGVKIVQRPTPHPQFGPLSRVRVMIEEAENVPIGIWDDVTNILSNANGVDRFKIVAPFNPKDANGQCALRVEPIDGWNSIDIEEHEEWQSKRGWKVVRLDAYKSENVVKGQEIFFGLQTKQGLEKVIANAGGVGTPGYYTMARGWFPPTGVDLAVIPQHLMNDIQGELEFVDSPTPCAALDVALEGGDNAILALGRRGTATGWRKPPQMGKEGEFVPFLDQFNKPIRRQATQIDQIFTLPKGDTMQLVQATKRTCEGAGVRGEWLGVDRTGNGAGVHDMLVRIFHVNVKGINPSTSPTEKKILDEDQYLPCDEYSYLLSELWFALRKHIEFGMLKISPKVATDPLHGELTGRRFLLSGKKTKVESKKEYKSRGNRSPDRADAVAMLVHVVRMMAVGSPNVTRSLAGFTPQREYKQRISVTDRMSYLD